jgi:hypothetical protein
MNTTVGSGGSESKSLKWPGKGVFILSFTRSIGSTGARFFATF